VYIVAADGAARLVTSGFLGVDEGYFVERPSARPWGEDYPTRYVGPGYEVGYELRPAGMSVEQRGRLQRDLVRAGVLAEQFTFGMWDAASQAAYRDLLSFANQAGVTEQQAMREWTAATDAGYTQRDDTARRQFDATQPDYTPQDPAVLSQRVKAWMREELGRDPSAEELSYLAAELEGEYRLRYDTTVGAEQAQFDATVGVDPRDALLADAGDPTGVPAPAPVTEPAEIDPYAEFVATATQRYEGEREMRDDALASQETGRQARNLIGQIRALTGGR
ncbi:MAG: hypothetical protein ACRDV2_12805, partial [Actinomycetes bacterium]